jgi:hypothetical protein
MSNALSPIIKCHLAGAVEAMSYNTTNAQHSDGWSYRSCLPWSYQSTSNANSLVQVYGWSRVRLLTHDSFVTHSWRRRVRLWLFIHCLFRESVIVLLCLGWLFSVNVFGSCLILWSHCFWPIEVIDYDMESLGHLHGGIGAARKMPAW